MILPLTILRRLDCVLQDTKGKVLQRHEALKGGKVKNLDPLLNRITGVPFHNISKLDFDKLKAAERERQYVPCRAGVLTAVVHANGDVGVCEQRPPLGNLREQSFIKIWRSHLAGQIRRSIRAKECYCTNEIFMWPSIVFQPAQLAKSAAGARVWERVKPLGEDERADYAESAAPLNRPPGSQRADPG